MCEHAACILTQNDIYWCETNSHTDEIERRGLTDVSDSPDFVRLQIVPPDKDYRRPFKEWKFQVDQKSRPEWFTEATAEAAVRAELPAWRARMVVMPNEVRERHASGLIVAVYGSVGEVTGSGRVGWVTDSGSVGRVTGSGRVGVVTGSGRVGVVTGSGRVGWVTDSGSVGRVTGSGRVGWVTGSGRVGWVTDSGSVGRVTGSGRVGWVIGSGCVHSCCDSGCAAIIYDAGHIVDMRGDKPRIIVAP